MSTPPHDPVFGALDQENHGHWRTTFIHRGKEIRADLNLDGDVDIERINKLTAKLADLEQLEQTAREAMANDLARPRGSAVELYREHHREELTAIESATGKQVTGKDSGFLSVCDLIAVALYPEYPSHCLILDFKLEGSTTDYQLVVSFDFDGRVAGVDMES